MTKDELKAELTKHNFKSYNEFMDFVERVHKMSAEDIYTIIREEYDAEHKNKLE